MNDLIDLLFCPIHGLFRPANWPILCTAYPMVRSYVSAVFADLRFRRMRNTGAI